MSTTVTKLANTSQAVSETTAWTNTANAQSKTDSNAVSSNLTGKNVTNTRSWGFPAFTTSDIPDDAAISAITLRYRYSSSVTGVTGGQLSVQGDRSGTTIGSAVNESQVTTLTTHTKDLLADGVTLSDLRTANVVRGRFGSTKGNTTTALTWNLEYVELEVVFTTPSLTQASHRIYADGTESGATALAAQDANYTANVSAGNVPLALRFRLQETAGAATPATDDWQLWVSKNGGAYTKLGAQGSVLDGYDIANTSGVTNIFGTTTGDGETFQAPASARVWGLGFWLNKVGSPTGSLRGKLFSTTGAFPGSATPNTLIDQSAIVSLPGLPTTQALQAIELPTHPAVTSGTAYASTFEYEAGSTATAGNCVQVGNDISSPTAAGFETFKDSGTWQLGLADICFAVYQLAAGVTGLDVFYSSNLTDGGATTNRLGAGSGSFLAGVVNEGFEVQDFSITASNYTELLFTVNLISASLANNDTLDFRVYRNGVAVNSYTVTPRITVSKSTGAITIVAAQGSYSLTGQAMTPAVSMPAAQGSYGLSGQAMIPKVSMLANQGSYAINGQTANFAISSLMAQGSYALNGKTVALNIGKFIPAAQGSYLINGQAANFNNKVPANQGSYALNGQAILMQAIRKITAVQGAYALTGQSINFTISMLANQGGYALNGQAMIPRISVPMTQGAYTLNGQTILMSKGLRIIAVQGSYALNGQTVNFVRISKVVANQGAYALNGQNVNFPVSMLANQGAYSINGKAINALISMLANQGAYALNGQPVIFGGIRRIVMNQGSYALNGQAVNALISMLAAKGQYNLTGQNVNFPVSMPANQGSYLLNGQIVNLKSLTRQIANQGSYALSGQAVALAVSMLANQGSYAINGKAINGLIVMPAAKGQYNLNGQNANLVPVVANTLFASAGSYTINGQNALLEYKRIMQAVQGAYSLTGRSANLALNHVLTASNGSFSIIGRSVGFDISMPLNRGLYALSGQSDILIKAPRIIANQGAYSLLGKDAALSSSGTFFAAKGQYNLLGQNIQMHLLQKILAQGGQYIVVGRDVNFVAVVYFFPPFFVEVLDDGQTFVEVLS